MFGLKVLGGAAGTPPPTPSPPYFQAFILLTAGRAFRSSSRAAKAAWHTAAPEQQKSGLLIPERFTRILPARILLCRASPSRPITC